MSVQELIDLVELLLKCSTYFAQDLIEISNLYEMSIEVEWKVSFKLTNLKFGSTLKASVEWKRNPSRSRGQITPTTIWFAWLTKDNAMQWLAHLICKTEEEKMVFNSSSKTIVQRLPRWWWTKFNQNQSSEVIPIILTRVQRQDCSEVSPFILANYLQRWVNLECWAASLPAGLISFRSRVGDTILSIFWNTGN